MHKLLHILIFLLVFNIYYINLAFSSSYVSANDFGDLPTVVVKAKPDHVSSVSSYSPDIASESITWVDSGLYTDGDPTGFYFEISGGWNPWTDSVTDYNNLCYLETKETIYPSSTGNNAFDIAVETGVNSEFDYITSSYKVSRNNDTYVKEEQSTEVKRSCWLTGGMGLYIAFFGTSGFEEPDIATHMKAVDIACDYPYNTDKNGDGVLTVDECYLPGDNSRNNQAYYRPYVSDQVVGGVRCEAASFLEDPTTRSDKVKVADCFDMINGEKIYKVKFTFQAKNLYKNKSGALVGANEKIKFGIYDKYYSDNHGEYKITLERGVSKDKTGGFLFEKIMKTIEEMFSISSLEKKYIKDLKINISNILENNTNILLSSLKISNFSLINDVYANAQNNTTLTNEEELYQKKVSLIKQFYKNIVYDGIFLQTIRTFIMLYICFLGLNLAMGGFQYSVKEFMNIVLKLSFILAFLSESGWDLYNEYIVTFFLKGLMSATTNIINIANKTYSPNAYIYIPEGTSLSSIFINIDSSLAFYFNRVIANKIWSLVFGVWCGIFLVVAIYLSIIFFFIKFVSSTFPIMIAYIELVLGLIIGPVFISFYLFKETQSIFMNWLAFLGARAANIFFTVFILSIFAETIKAQFVELLSFPIYYIEILPSWLKTFFKVVFHKDISWVVAVADFSVAQKPGFEDMFILIGKVFALVQLFSLILNALPGIIDSIVDIKGGKGGSMASTVGTGNFIDKLDAGYAQLTGTKKGKSLLKQAEEWLTPQKLGGELAKWAWGATFGEGAAKRREKTLALKNNAESREIMRSTNSLKAINARSNGMFADLLKDEKMLNKLVDYDRKAKTDLLFSADREENCRAIEFLKFKFLYDRLENSRDIGKYVKDGKVDLEKFARDHFDKLTDEDKALYKSYLEAQLNSIPKFDYYQKLQEVNKALENYESLSDEDKEKKLKEIEKDVKYLEYLETVLRDAQIIDKNVNSPFLMEGLDVGKFGLSGASDFQTVAGIGNDFLGFNGGAANVVGNMGIQLNNADE